MKCFKAFYNCSMWAMVIALTSLFYLAIKKREIGTIFSIVNIIFCMVYSYTLYGGKRLQVVPASILREGMLLIALKDIREKRKQRGTSL
ncbi:hypothetical protein [Clostridium sp. C105KSO13]|uniref:hypothetical protein n=1 Tax=Clostridium sp. C105KSO13 TaxID=1776045 RepID=UPI000B7D6AE3|nr:hypothetical protein [Clostridium sp. C105KSO13]